MNDILSIENQFKKYLVEHKKSEDTLKNAGDQFNAYLETLGDREQEVRIAQEDVRKMKNTCTKHEGTLNSIKERMKEIDNSLRNEEIHNNSIKPDYERDRSLFKRYIKDELDSFSDSDTESRSSYEEIAINLSDSDEEV
jgi:chromosome segregation ATPase